MIAMRSDPRFWFQLVRVGARSLRVHKLRSSLTMLGMVFGVASVVSILAIGEGASYEVQAQLRRLGPDRIVLRSVLPGDASGSDRRIDYGLKLADLARSEALVPGIAAIAPCDALEKEVHQGATSKLGGPRAPLVCTTPSFLGIHQLGLSRGRFLSDSDLDTSANETRPMQPYCVGRGQKFSDVHVRMRRGNCAIGISSNSIPDSCCPMASTTSVGRSPRRSNHRPVR